MIRAPVGILFNRFYRLNIYCILIAQVFNFYSVLYLKCFGTFQSELEMAELYKNKVKFI